jgi:glycosyltransferase involved in cell wall biosynthesis
MVRWRSILNCLLALPTSMPLQAVYSWHTGLSNQTVNQILSNGHRRFDVIHVEHLRGARYGQFVKTHFPQIPVVWDSVDCISYLFAQAGGRSRSLFGKLISQFELGRTRKYEGGLPARFDHVLVTSPVDRRELLNLVPKDVVAAPVTVIPNGVDLDYFNPGDWMGREPATVLFSGKMSYHANITMALYLANEIMPIIWRQRPDVRLSIVGKDPPRNIQALRRNPGIDVSGTVDDIRPYVQRATVATVPLIYGAGLQNKVLEAMACATPVVATPGAISALQAQDGRDLLVAQDARDFARHILSLIQDITYQHKLGQAGRGYVEKYHKWEAVVGQLEGIYNEVIHSKPKFSGYRGGKGTAKSS